VFFAFSRDQFFALRHEFRGLARIHVGQKKKPANGRLLTAEHSWWISRIGSRSLILYRISTEGNDPSSVAVLRRVEENEDYVLSSVNFGLFVAFVCFCENRVGSLNRGIRQLRERKKKCTRTQIHPLGEPEGVRPWSGYGVLNWFRHCGTIEA